MARAGLARLKSEVMTENHPRPRVLLLIALVGPLAGGSCHRGNPEPIPMGALSGCTVCHVDVANAFAGSKHRQKGIDCTRCHGLSKGHIEDENNEVKPERVFRRHEIDRWCDGCHFRSCKHAEGVAVLSPASKRRTCADCHGAHSARIPQSPGKGRDPNPLGAKRARPR